MLEQAITSLAILKVNWDQDHAYLENFVPFVAECLRTAPQAEVSLPELQVSINQMFGLTIPQGVLKTILQRAEKHGYIEQKGVIHRRNDDTLSTLDFARVRDDALRQHEALVRKLIEFCKDHYTIQWSQEEAEAALLSYLRESSTPILATAVDGQPLPDIQPVKHAEFIINAFIKNLYEGDPDGFKFLETVVKGSMLASVLFLPDPDMVSRQFERVEVYFDTPFLLRALGLVGPSMQAPCRELLDLVYELGGSLRCFAHTLNEILGILNFDSYALRNRNHLRGSHGATLEYFITSGYKSSDVELIISRLEQSLRALRVEVKQKPPQTEPLGLDEEKLELVLKEEVKYHLNPEACFHDLDALTAIHRLRGGKSHKHIETCDAIFITTNAALVRASARFFNEAYDENTAPFCLLDYPFTTLIWLKKPLEAPDLPKKKIIANCYAAMRPPDRLWKKYLQEIGQLQLQDKITLDDYHLLRYSMEARTILMNCTLGDPGAFSEGTIPEVLEQARAAARVETEAGLQAEKEKRLAAENRAVLAETRMVAQRQSQLQRFRNLGTQGGRWIARCILCIGTVLIILGIYLTLPRPFPTIPGELSRLATPVVLTLVAIFSIANLTFGTTLNSLVRRLEVYVARAIERTLIRVTVYDEG